jgi:hypothetical protein
VTTAGFKFAQAEHPRLKVVDKMGLLNLLQGFSGGCNPPPGQLEKPFVLLDELCPKNGRQPSIMDELV